MQEFKRQINTIIRENGIPFLMLNIYHFTFALAVPFKNWGIRLMIPMFTDEGLPCVWLRADGSSVCW